MLIQYYFEKWISTLKKLEDLVHRDIEYQESKVHDNSWCEAVQRLTGVLASYMFIYNDVIDCYRHNLQVQKAKYMKEIIDAIVAKISELKAQLRKITATDCQFMGNSLTDNKLTMYDVELSEIPYKLERPDNIKTLILDAMQRAKDRMEKSVIPIIEEPERKLSEKNNWWDNETEDAELDQQKGLNFGGIYELKEIEVTGEKLEEKKMVTLIQAHERLRKVILLMTKRKQRKEMWKKELEGTLQPPARLELKNRSAKLIQTFFR